MAMPSDLAFEDRSEYIHCTYFGLFRYPDVADAALAIGKRCLELTRPRVLVDIRPSLGELSVAERYQVANEMSHHWPRNVRLAVFGRPDQEVPDHAWEVVAIERGLHAAVFTDQAGALAWLLA